MTVKKVLEGDLSLRCAEVDAKMINGDFVNIHSSEHIRIGAMYSKRAKVSAVNGVGIDGVHGTIEVSTYFAIQP